MMSAVLSNPGHPEYGVATIPFPIPHDQYAHCMELLEALEIGDAVKADCKVEKIDSFYTVLKRTEMLTVNVEELNYLAKRLDSFDTGEAAQFQAMAHKLDLFELKDLIISARRTTPPTSPKPFSPPFRVRWTTTTTACGRSSSSARWS